MSGVQTPSAMRLAFEQATRAVPKAERTREYAMVRSALNRRLGMARRNKQWSVARGGK